jgi:hypothetical protein
MKMFLVFLPLLVAASLISCGALPPTTEEPRGGAVYIDSSDLLIMESYPVQVALHIVGNLSTPCHEFHSEVTQPDDQNRIFVTAWSEADPAAMCAQVLQPFDTSVSIPMSGAADGTYSVWLNGEEVGEFTYPG